MIAVKKIFAQYWWLLLFTIIIIVVPNQRPFYLQDDFKKFEVKSQVIFLVLLIVFFTIKIWLDMKTIRSLKWTIKNSALVFVFGAVVAALYYFVAQDVFTNFGLFINRQMKGDKISRSYIVLGDEPLIYDLDKQQYSNDRMILKIADTNHLHFNEKFKIELCKGLLGVYYLTGFKAQ